MKALAYLALISSIRSAPQRVFDFSDIPLAGESRIDTGSSKTIVMKLNRTKDYKDLIRDHLYDKHIRVFASEDVFNKDGTDDGDQPANFPQPKPDDKPEEEKPADPPTNKDDTPAKPADNKPTTDPHDIHDENTHPPEPVNPENENHGKYSFNIKDINRMAYYTTLYVGSDQQEIRVGFDTMSPLSLINTASCEGCISDGY